MDQNPQPEYQFHPRDALVGAQMLFVAFGALVLVPILTGLNPNVALFCAGFGTLLFQLVTGGKVPIFLGSSFAFIAPIIYGVKTWGLAVTQCGLVAAGLFYLLLAGLIALFGVRWLERLLPPIVTGPVIMVIGLVLAPVAVNMAMGKSGDGAVVLFPESTALPVALFSLAVTVLVSLYGRGIFKLVPILAGVAAGYILGFSLGMVRFDPVAAAPWFALPPFTFPAWQGGFDWVQGASLAAVLYILPIAIAPAIEHFGDIIAIGSVTGRNYLQDPGIHRTMLGDGLAVTIGTFLGGPPVTTYSEVTGAVALIKIRNAGIMTWAALTALCLSFVGKLGALLQTIPTPVMGGIMILLFGAILVVGISTLVRAQLDLMRPRNLAIVGIMIVCGLGGMCLKAGACTLTGIGLAGLVGVFLNLVLPRDPGDDTSVSAAGVTSS